MWELWPAECPGVPTAVMPGTTSLPSLVGAQPLQHLAGEHPAIVLEQTFHAPLGRAAHLAVVHPELVLARRHQNFGVGEGQRTVGLQQAVDVIAVIVRDDDGIDRLGVDAGGSQIGHQLAARSLGRLERRLARAGVDEHKLLAGVDDDRIVRTDENVRLHVEREQRRVDLLLLDVGDEIVRQLEAVDTVGDHRDLEVRRPCSGTSPAPACRPVAPRRTPPRARQAERWRQRRRHRTAWCGESVLTWRSPSCVLFCGSGTRSEPRFLFDPEISG